jgi:hypothetical protein
MGASVEGPLITDRAVGKLFVAPAWGSASARFGKPIKACSGP